MCKKLNVLTVFSSNTGQTIKNKTIQVKLKKKSKIVRRENANSRVVSGVFIAVRKLFNKIESCSFQGIAGLTCIKQKWLEWC